VPELRRTRQKAKFAFWGFSEVGLPIYGVHGSLAEKLGSLTAIVVLLLYALEQRGDPRKKCRGLEARPEYGRLKETGRALFLRG